MPRPFASADWYDEPRYYDIAFAGESRAEASFLEAVLARHGRSGARALLEPACGSGRLLRELVRRGYRVTGFDANEAMVRYARARLSRWPRRAQVLPGRLERFALAERFDLAFCLVSTFRYLLSEADACSHLKSVHDALRPGGLYVLGLLLSEYGANKCSRERWVGRRGGVQVVCNTQSWPPDPRRRRERFRSRLTVTRGGHQERFDTCWEFRTYDAAQLRRTLRAVDGLEHVCTYDFSGTLDSERTLSDEQLDVIVVLRKRT